MPAFIEAVELRKVAPRIPPNVPKELQDLISPLLRSDPAERPQSAAELVRIAAAEPAAAAPASAHSTEERSSGDTQRARTAGQDRA